MKPTISKENWRKLRRSLLFLLPVAAFAAAAIFGYVQWDQKRQYQRHLTNNVHRSIYELVDSLNNMEVSLGKLQVSDMPSGSLVLLSDIKNVSNLAQSSISQLPIVHEALGDTARFINQVGDYCNTLEQHMREGRPLSDSDRQQIEGLTQQCGQLNQSLYGAIEDGIRLEAFNSGNLVEADTGGDLFGDPALEYPTLLYDGPFSDAAQSRKAKSLSDTWVDYYQAVTIATAYVGENRISDVLGSAPYSGDVPAWGIELLTHEGAQIYIYVTKQGGQVLWMLQDTVPGASQISLEECRENALVFLESRGYEAMMPSYAQSHDGIGVFSFAASQEGVLLYPDLVKVQVSMETGLVIGVEARNYVYNHIRRTDLRALVSQEEACSRAGRLDIEGSRLCVIPLPDGSECLAWEVGGFYLGDRYLLYINAQTGVEENILKLVDTPNGTLTM